MNTANANEPWRPLSARENESAAQAYDARHLGVPNWLRPSLWRWIATHVTRTRVRTTEEGTTTYQVLDMRLVREVERRLHLTVGWGIKPGDEIGAFQMTLFALPDHMIDVTDFLVSRHDLQDQDDSESLIELEKLLSEGGSAYTVNTTMRPPCLMRRVDRTVEQAANQLMVREDDPGELLRLAWKATYGLHSNPSEGYRLAVRAVEAAAVPVVLPTDPSATLGKVSASLRDGAHNWQLALTHRTDPQRPVKVLVENLTLLWQAQYDRHVSQGMPLQVSQEEAETALHLAVTLVQWFTSGRVSRRP